MENVNFSYEDILDLTSDTIFERGEDYYNKSFVGEIIFSDNKYRGIVTGERKYNVSLNISDYELKFTCDCPYEYGNICKHEVAFALKILNGEYIDTKEEFTNNGGLQIDDFKKCYNETDTNKKLNFLKQLLDKDTNLQNQFIAFTKIKSENLDTITGINIDTVKNQIHERLLSIDLDDIFENYQHNYQGYYDDSDGYVDDAEDEIRQYFSDFKEKATRYIKKGDLINAFRIMIGLYEGSQNLEEPESDYDFFGDTYEYKVFVILKEIFNDFANEIKSIVKSDEMVIQVFNLLVDRFRQNKLHESQSNDDTDSIYDLKIFEALILSLLINESVAQQFFKIIKTNHLFSLDLAYIILRIGEMTNNEELWLETTEKFFAIDKEIAKQLLEKYKEKNNAESFIRICKYAFKTWPDSFDSYLLKNLDKEKNKALYLKALGHYTANNRSKTRYIEYREYLSESERKNFVDKMKSSYDSQFYVHLLEIEKRYEDILKYVKKNEFYYTELTKVILPIINIYPTECYEILENKCNSSLNSYNRGRSTYKQIVSWLLVMKKIESKRTETQVFIKSLYDHIPRLPALKDEITKAGLLK